MFAGCESRDDEKGSTFSLFTVLRSSLSHFAFAVALLFGMLLGDHMLIPNTLMPDTVRFSHLLDELWSFAAKKTNQAWIWIALCRQTRQVVAYAIGDRSQATCRRLWEVIPPAYHAGHCFSDFWAVYQAVIPEEQHTAVGKEAGETAHVKRWNNTLRQRLACFVRKTLSFSKSLVMHEARLPPLSSSLQP